MIYRDVFILVFTVPCLISIVFGYFSANVSRQSTQFVLFGFGVFFFWAGLFLASDIGYRAWQATPDPPPEAFSDSGPIGALVFGWFPAILFCLVIRAMSKASRWLLRRSASDPDT